MRNKKSKLLNTNIFDNFRTENSAPIYDASGNVVRNKKKNWIKKIPPAVFPITFIIIFILGIIYLPQFFISDSRKSDLLYEPNQDAHKEMLKYVKNNSDDDYDMDGLTNYKELELGTDPFFNDTDSDGILDGYDNNPTKKNDKLYSAILAQGEPRSTPYEINGVILWPDDKNSWTYGAVIPVRNGYQFTNFSGWAKFPSGKYAYQYVDGRHTLLEHNEKANTWKITRNCVVVLTDDKPENTHQISFFGKEVYLRNGLGSFLSWLLPEKGWITAKTMWLDDTFIDTSSNTYAPYIKLGPTSYASTRFGGYSKTLESLAEVYSLIDEGHAVLASIISPEQGEIIAEVYGYTSAGHLIVADPQVKSAGDIIIIDIHCSRSLSIDERITENAWFEFYGCGYDSMNGAMISFFSTAKEAS